MRRRVTAVAPIKGRFILAEGEQTGHHHSVPATPNVTLLSDGAQTFLTVKQRAVKLAHQEHDPLTIAPGDYEIVQQRYIMPGQEARVTRVID